MFHLIQSNRLEVAATILRNQLFHPDSHPLQQRFVVVPSKEIKTFLIESFLKESDSKSVAGIQILTPDRACAELSICAGLIERPKSPTRLQLLLLIQEALLKNYQTELFAPISEYLLEEGKISFGKLGLLCDRLAGLFLDYGIYALEKLDSWLKESGWQQTLWQEIYKEEWSYPLKTLKKKIDSSVEIHLFHCASLPPLYLHFFAQFNLTFYLFSSTAHYALDLETKKEQLLKGEAFEGNSLLSNWGKLARKQQSVIFDLATQSDEFFLQPEGKGALALLQRDLLEMRTDKGKEAGIKEDFSIQLHGAPSIKREVEVLYDAVCNFLSKNRGRVSCRDIAVYAPNIELYLPYLRMVFERSKIECDFPISNQREVIQGAELFFALATEGFDERLFMRLVANPLFMKSYQLEPSALKSFQKFIAQGGICWGIDTSHKQKVLMTNEPLAAAGSFEDGIARLIWGCACSQEDLGESLPLPAAELELTSATLLGTFIAIYSDLKESLLPIINGEEMPLESWIFFLKERFTLHFGADGAALFNELSIDLKTKRKLPYAAISLPIKKLLAKKRGATEGTRGVQFRSVNPDLLHPAKMIFLIGMDESAFPRVQQVDPLNELPVKAGTSQLDRSLFLELIGQATEQLCISYLYLSPADGKEQAPSILVQEMIDYLAQRLENGPYKTKHAIDPFNERYYEEKSSFTSYSIPYYRALLKKRLNQVFKGKSSLPFLYKETAEQTDLLINIKDFSKLMRNPVQFYCNEVLGVYLQKDVRSEKKKGELLLSALDKHKLVMESSILPVDQVIARAKKAGHFPDGSFTRLGALQIEEEVRELLATYKLLGIDPAQRFSITLDPLCKEVTELVNGSFLLPAIEIKAEGGRQVTVVGTLNELVPSGIVFHATDEIKDLIKKLPALLIYHCSDLPSDLKGDKIYLTKEGVIKQWKHEKAAELLQQLISYYLASLQGISPMHPFLAQEFLKADERQFTKLAAEFFSRKKELPYEEPYLEWLIAMESPYPGQAIYQSWEKTVFQLFGPCLNGELFV